jgi:hypothetical protein
VIRLKTKSKWLRLQFVCHGAKHSAVNLCGCAYPIGFVLTLAVWAGILTGFGELVKTGVDRLNYDFVQRRLWAVVCRGVGWPNRLIEDGLVLCTMQIQSGGLGFCTLRPAGIASTTRQAGSLKGWDRCTGMIGAPVGSLAVDGRERSLLPRFAGKRQAHGRRELIPGKRLC